MSEEAILLPEVTTVVQVRFSDTDMMGHISSMSYGNYAEVGRADFFTAVPGEIPWFVMVHLGMDFLAEGRFGQEFRILTRCESLGNKSLTLRQVISADGKPVCSIKAVLAGFDRKTRGSVAIPSHWAIEPESP